LVTCNWSSPIYEDNQACIKTAKNDLVQARANQSFSRQAVKSEEVKLIYCPTQLMLADALTKARSEVSLQNFQSQL
jgi:hypothetical protein